MKPVHRTLLILLLACLAGAACTSTSPTAIPTAWPTSAPAPTQVPPPIPTPVPINATQLAGAVPLAVDNAATLQPLLDLWGSGQVVSDIVFLPGTDLIAFGTGTLSVYEQLSFKYYRGVYNHTQVMLWDPLSNTARDAFEGGDRADLFFNSLAISPDGSHLAFVGSDQVILASATGSPANGNLAFTTQALPAGKIAQASMDDGAAFSPDGAYLAVLDGLGNVQVWDVASGQVLGDFLYGYGSTANCLLLSNRVAFTPDGKSVLAACDDKLFIGDLATFTSTSIKLQLPVNVHYLNVFALAPDGQSLFSGDDYGNTQVWGFPSGKLQTELKNAHSDRINAIQFSPDGSLAASSSRDGTVDVWDAHTWTRLATLPTQADLLAFSPDGRFLVTATHDAGAKLWGVLSSDSRTAMQGVKVVLTAGPMKMDAWQAAVPQAWLAPTGTLPRYEIHITSSTSILDSCSYSLSDGSTRTLNRDEIAVTAAIIDLQSGQTVEQTTFQGGTPDSCPATATFNQYESVGELYGSEPDMAEFLPWLNGVMGPFGYH